METEGATGVLLAVLGDVTVHAAGGKEIPLSPQRAHILAVLAAAAGSVVPRSELLDDLWGEDSEASRHRLKSQIAQIRALLGAELAIEFHLDGYQLRGSLDRLDSTLFESMVTSCRALATAARAERYGRALELWRAPVAFHGIDSLLVDDARRRLDTLWATTVLELADCEIELRRPRDAVALLGRLLDDDPTRGDVTTRLASLLALGSREVESMRVIRRHREAMVEFGFLLSPELEELELQILRHDFIAPAPTSHPRRDETPFLPGLIKRAELEERVAEALTRGPVILCGEAGVGKTVLTQAVIGNLQDAGRAVTVASARPDPTRPMDVMAEIIEQLRLHNPGLLKAQLERPSTAAAVARLSGERVATGPTITRELLIAELTLLVRSIVTTADGVLIVEDAHWLDPSSAEIIGHLVEADLPGLLVTTRRSLVEIFGETWRGGTMIEMPAFSLAEVRALMELALPARATDALAADLHRGSGGNGVFLRLELELLAEGQLGHTVSPTLLDAVNQRTRMFSASTRNVLQTAALLGRSFPLAPLAAIHRHVHEAVREAADERLVRLDTESGMGEFVHGLVVDALVDLLPDAVRISRHDQLCRALWQLDESPIAVATQAVGAELLDPIRVIVTCLGAAQQQAAVFEWASAIEWARLSLAARDRSGFDDPRIEAELRTLVGTGLRRLNLPGSDDELGHAAELASAAGAHELLVRSVTELCLHGPTTKAGTVDAVARRHLDRALAAPVAPVRRAELLSAAATLMALSDESSHGRSLYRQALDVAEQAGDPALLRAIRMNAHLGLSHPDDLEARRRATAGLLALDDDEANWEGNFLRFGIALIDADRSSLDASVDALRRLTSIVKQRVQQRALLQVETVHAFIRGDLDDAGRLADESLRVALMSYPVSWSTGIYAALLVPIREVEGRAGELLPEVSALIDSAPGFITWHAIAADVAYARRDEAAMASELRHLADLDFRFAEDLTWTAIATMVCRPIWALHDARSAEVVYGRLHPYSGLMTWNGLSTHGPIDAGLACLAAVLGNAEAVTHHVEVSRTLVARLGAHHLLWPELEFLGNKADGFAPQRDPLPQVG